MVKNKKTKKVYFGNNVRGFSVRVGLVYDEGYAEAKRYLAGVEQGLRAKETLRKKNENIAGDVLADNKSISKVGQLMIGEVVDNFC